MANDSLNSYSDDRRRKLYERFRSELVDDRRNMFFDEEDIIEVFDFATDTNDRFTALEALILAERLFPASNTMAERKAIFCLSLDDETAARALTLLPDDSVVKTLTGLRLAHSTPKEAAPVFDEILRSRPELTDEELIQLCDTAEELGMYQWLLDNKEAVKAHTDYPQTFLYELCQIGREQDPDSALAILEELTMMEPFSTDFWLLTAQIHIEQGHPDKALQPVEYALAIEPGNVNALMTKAHAQNELNYPPEQVEATLREIIAIDPSLAPPVLALAMLTIQDKDAPDEGMKILRDYDTAHPGNPQTLDIMLMAIDRLPADETVEKEISSFLTPAMSGYLDHFIEMARRHADEGRHRAAALLLLCLDRVYHLSADFDYMMEELYRAGFYRKAFEGYQAHFRIAEKTVQVIISDINDCFAAFWFILSAIRLEILDGIGVLVSGLIAAEPLNGVRSNISDILESKGLTDYLVKINAYLTGDTSLTPDDLDPFVESGNPFSDTPSQS